MTICEFITKWRKVELKERSAAQEHFIDLCNVFGHPTPAAADPTGESFCFEKGAAKHGGGDFGLEPIRHFNGNLFDDPPPLGGYGGTSRTVLDLTTDDVKRIAAAASLDWSAVDPSIFGTLFERSLDPNTRAQLGAHFTSREDIELVVDAVVMAPLRREWAETKATVERLLTTGRKTAAAAYGWPADLSDEAILERLLALNQAEAGDV